jgi:hypothetical protein
MLLAAYLDPAGIPLELFTTPTMVHCLTDLAACKVRARDARKAVRALVRLTLLNEDEGARWREITVHSLVQRATREAHHGEHEVRTIADALVETANHRDDRIPAAVLHDNARSLSAYAGAALWDPDGHPLLFGLGESIGHCGRVRAAAEHFQQLAATATDQLGADHPDNLLARSRYAGWLAAAGHPGLAADELE